MQHEDSCSTTGPTNTRPPGPRGLYVCSTKIRAVYPIKILILGPYGPTPRLLEAPRTLRTKIREAQHLVFHKLWAPKGPRLTESVRRILSKTRPVGPLKRGLRATYSRTRASTCVSGAHPLTLRTRTRYSQIYLYICS